MRGRDDDRWGTSGLIRKDFRQSHDDPEVIPGKSLKKKHLCKGGKPHEWEQRSVPLMWSDREKKMVAHQTWRAGTFCKRCNKRQWSWERPKAPKGCAGNDGNAHVYVWVKYVHKNYSYASYRKICAGCNKDSGKRNYGSPPENIYETRTTGW